MSPLKYQHGKLLSRNGHLCLSCCPPHTRDCLDVIVDPEGYETGVPIHEKMYGSIAAGEFFFEGISWQRLFWDPVAGSWVFVITVDHIDYRYLSDVPDRSNPAGRYNDPINVPWLLDIVVVGACE